VYCPPKSVICHPSLFCRTTPTADIPCGSLLSTQPQQCRESRLSMHSSMCSASNALLSRQAACGRRRCTTRSSTWPSTRHTLNTAVFMDYSVCSSAIGNIQDLMRNSNVQCHLATTYTCLCTEVLRQSSNWDKILVIGIHAGFRFSKDEQVDEYLCFLEECKQLADENMVQAEFVNLQHLDWTCCVPDATFHCTQDSNSLWVYHTSWEQQLMKARQLYRKPPQSAAHQPTKPPIN